MPHHESAKAIVFSKRVALGRKKHVHENEPRHPLIRHTLRQVVCHEDIQRKLQKRGEHVEHPKEVEQRDGNVEDMLESYRWNANEYAPKWIRDEQTSDELQNFTASQNRQVFEGLRETPRMRWRCAGVDHPPWLKADAYLDLVYGGTERVCERGEETVHGEGCWMVVDTRQGACHQFGTTTRSGQSTRAPINAGDVPTPAPA